MKNIKLFSLISLFAFVFNSCSSLEEPVDPALLRVVITTKAMSNVDMNTASSGGEILQDGNSEITERGVVWGLTANPTVINSKSISGSGLGSYNSNLTGLSANRSYFLRAYAINSSGVHYGNQVVFTTTAVSNLAVLTTTAISNNNTGISAISGGNITSQGGSAVIARGVVWSTNPFPTTTDFKTTNGSGTGAFVSTLNGLSLATTYYVRAYATNSMITAYGNQFTFTTSANPVIVHGYFKGKLDGVIFDRTFSSVNPNCDMQSATSYSNSPYIIDYSCIFMPAWIPPAAPLTMPNFGIEFDNVYNQPTFAPQSAAFYGLFTTPPTNFLTDADNTSNMVGMQVFHTVDATNDFTTLMGSQTGSVMTITSSVSGMAGSRKIQTITGTVNCKLYNSFNISQVKILTDGEFKIVIHEAQ